MRDKTKFTVIFEGDLSKIVTNPFLIESAFGKVLACRFGDACEEPDGPRNEPKPDKPVDLFQANLAADIVPKTRRKARSQIPDGFPFEVDLAWSQTLWLQKGRADLCSLAGEEADRFRDHHSGKLTASADWPASWRTWARNAIKFSNGGHNGRATQARKPTAHDNFNAGISSYIAKLGKHGEASGESQAGGDPIGETGPALLEARLHRDAG